MDIHFLFYKINTMNFLKKVFYLTSIALLFSQCKAYQVDTKPSDMKYSDFTSQQKTWNSPDGKIAYIDKGEGTPLLLLHGIPTSGWLYRKMIDPLVAKGYRVIAPDMLGFGNSAHPSGYDIFDKSEHAKRILGLMSYLKIDNWHHVMHDAGGLWTWELFKQAPSKISKLSILNTIIYQDGFCPPIRIKKGIIGKIIMWSYRTKTNMMVKKLFEGGTNGYSMSKADTEGYVMPLRKGKTNALYKFFTTNTKSIPDYSKTLQQIDIPVQVIWGESDKILVWEKEATAVTKDLKIKEENIHILNKNHFLQEEAAEELIRLIGDFK